MQVPIRSKRNHMQSIIDSLDVSRPRDKTDMYDCCATWPRRTPRRGMMVLFSDLLADPEGTLRGLRLLRQRGHDVLVFHVMDDDELDFPFAGPTRFRRPGVDGPPELQPASAARGLPGTLLARIELPREWLGAGEGEVTHHIVLLDDSYSMADRAEGASAFDRAQRAVQDIAMRVADSDAPQKFTLIRFSRASRTLAQATPTAEGEAGAAPLVADISGVEIHPELTSTLEDVFRGMDISDLSIGPAPSLKAVKEILDSSEDSHHVLYVVSDFRDKEWSNPVEIQKELKALTERETNPASLRLVDCVNQQHPNLGIVMLEPARRTKAAGVPLYMRVAVKNFGPGEATDVVVNLTPHYYDPTLEKPSAAGQLKTVKKDKTIDVIRSIGAGETVEREIQIFFPGPGQHAVEASIPDDPVATDNRRCCTVDLPSHAPVLVIDGENDPRNDAYYLESVFQPGERTPTGIRPELKSVAFLRDKPLEDINQYQAIYLLNVPQLDDRAVANLKAYLDAGGHAAVFMGPQCDLAFYNDLYDDGNGIFPLPLERQEMLAPTEGAKIPDIEAKDHPVFDGLSGAGNENMRNIRVEQYIKTRDGTISSLSPDTRILASLRNRDPLVAEKTVGNGSLVAVLTSVKPGWNNCAVQPFHALFHLNMQSYFSAPRQSEQSKAVGAALATEMDADQYKDNVTMVYRDIPAEKQTQTDRTAEKLDDALPILTAFFGRDTEEETPNGETDRAGIYELWRFSKKGEANIRRFAMNVDPTEGDLARVEEAELRSGLNPVEFDYFTAQEMKGYAEEESRSSSSRWAETILAILIALLLLEQFLAYSASYHAATGGAR
jgi:hypothetical protein